jgi:hypothetical protein
VVGAVLVCVGLALVITTLVAPDQVQQVRGSVRRAIHTVDIKLRHHGVAQVDLGPPGGKPALDDCTGKFIEMIQYRRTTSLQPTYAAHNYCDGDVILPWSEGTVVRVRDTTGHRRPYRVTDTRNLPKFTSTTEDLLGLSGELVLQTCYWGKPTIHVVALTPVGVKATSQPRKPSSHAVPLEELN